MGIQGLLPLLKSIQKHTTLKAFAGQTIGVDGYGWLHRGTVACAIELALDKPTTKYVDFAVKQVRMLLDFGVTPYVVFDGDSLPSKSGTNAERRKKREEAKKYGLELYKAGKLSQAYPELQKAAGVTPQMARHLIEELKKMEVRYVVAPYEADAQLAYLERKGIINGVLSEDSDLLVYGVKRLITKLNQYGECVEIERSNFRLCKEVSLTGWTDSMFRRMAILSGCDYLPSIDKMGLKTAYRFVRKYKEPEKTLRMIAFEGKFCVPAGYLDKFKQAELTFLHHRVFCPIQKKMVFLEELEEGVLEDDLPYLGAHVKPEIVIGVACGDLNPRNKEPLEARTNGLSRPALTGRRQQLEETPSDLKKKPSIDSFFSSQRTPLAELDPNTLTPSPSQQSLLERNRNASWDPQLVRSAPGPQRNLRRTDTLPIPKSTDRAAFLSRASTMSSYKPPKRQRLCSESGETSSPKGIKKSPFFPLAAPAISPLGIKKSTLRKADRQFDVFSDDSFDDALLDFPDVQQLASPEVLRKVTPTKYSKPVCPAGDQEIIIESSPTKATYAKAQEMFAGDLITNNKEAATNDSGTTDNSNKDQSVFEDSDNVHAEQQKHKLAKTFFALSSDRQDSALRSLQIPKVQKVVAGSSSTIVVEQGSYVQPLGTSINGTASLIQTFAYQSTERQKKALDSIPQTQASPKEKSDFRATSTHKKRQIRKHATDHAISTGPRTAYPWPHAYDVRGSEETIPNSSEDEASEADDGALRPAISLDAFAFVA